MISHPGFSLILAKIHILMAQKHGLIAELQMEAANTRRIFEKVPTDKNDWKPHERSMKLGSLATHIAELPSWAIMAITTDELDLSKMDYKPVIAVSTEELLAKLDDNVSKAVAVLENTTDEDLEKMWTLRNGEHVIFSLPKKVVVRNMSYSHLYHHRGQLSVYLRLLNVHVPGMYGPSADEKTTHAVAEEVASAN
jgi:uncharacterized damage-inducible protein DinB